MSGNGDYISREAARKLACEICGDCDGGVDVCQFRDLDVDAIPAADVRPVVLCRDCRHRDPEDHKCDCGQLERAGCIFPVDDDYFCAYGERPNCGADMRPEPEEETE